MSLFADIFEGQQQIAHRGRYKEVPQEGQEPGEQILGSNSESEKVNKHLLWKGHFTMNCKEVPNYKLIRSSVVSEKQKYQSTFTMAIL